MHLISNTQHKYIINHKSTNEFYNYVQFNFDDKCFEQIQSIGCENMMQLDSETFELLNILGLNYLLFNYDINFDKALNVQLSYIKHIENNIERFNAILIYLDYSPYYTMKSIDFDLKLCCEYGYIKMLDWVKQNTNYVLKFNSSHIIAICTTEHLNILDWIINNIDVHDVKTDIISISFICREGHVNFLNWLHNHKIKILYDIYTIEKAREMNNIVILKWFQEHILTGFHNETYYWANILTNKC